MFPHTNKRFARFTGYHGAEANNAGSGSRRRGPIEEPRLVDGVEAAVRHERAHARVAEQVVLGRPLHHLRAAVVPAHASVLV